MGWITPDDVVAALGVTPSTMDAPYLGVCVDAANAWAFRRRATAGYVDYPATAPGPDVALGTTLYAVALFRERGSTDSYASFEELASGFAPTGTSTQINRLLGIGKPAADRGPRTPVSGVEEVVVSGDEPPGPGTDLWVDTSA